MSDNEKGSSTLPFTISKDKGQVPVLNEVRPVGVWAYHPLRTENGSLVSFAQHLAAAKACATHMLEEFATELELAAAMEFGGPDLSQPFCLQVALVAGDSERGNFMEKLVKNQENKHMEFAKDLSAQVKEFLDLTLPKLLWKLRITLGAKRKTGKAAKATHIAFYFEFSMKQNSATLEQLRKVITRKEGEQAKTRAKLALVPDA